MIDKILVIGVGFLGSKILKEFEKHQIAVLGTHLSKRKNNSKTLDITKHNEVRRFFEKIEPDVVINCAASTNIDAIEKNPELGYSVNAKGVKNVAENSHEFGIKLIQISTDSVFDGTRGMYTEEDIPNPINFYSKSKLKGEEEVKNNCKNYVIIRTNFYGIDEGSKFLFSKILSELKLGKKIVGFDDVIFNPLETTNLSQLIYDVATTSFQGILHLSSDKIITKYQFCVKIAKAFNLDKNLIKKGSVDEFEFIAKRPKNTSLSNTRSKQIIKTPLVSFDDWLKKIVNCV